MKTDYNPLIHAQTHPTINNRQTMWMQKLSHYNYKVEYKASISNISTNSMSRRPNHYSTKTKFVNFCDLHGFLLISACVFL